MMVSMLRHCCIWPPMPSSRSLPFPKREEHPVPGPAKAGPPSTRGIAERQGVAERLADSLAPSRAAELRDRLDDLGSKPEGAQAELATAQDQVEALDQAEAERRARGVLARLSAALRRE